MNVLLHKIDTNVWQRTESHGFPEMTVMIFEYIPSLKKKYPLYLIYLEPTIPFACCMTDKNLDDIDIVDSLQITSDRSCQEIALVVRGDFEMRQLVDCFKCSQYSMYTGEQENSYDESNESHAGD